MSGPQGLEAELARFEAEIATPLAGPSGRPGHSQYYTPPASAHPQPRLPGVAAASGPGGVHLSAPPLGRREQLPPPPARYPPPPSAYSGPPPPAAAYGAAQPYAGPAPSYSSYPPPPATNSGAAAPALQTMPAPGQGGYTALAAGVGAGAALPQGLAGATTLSAPQSMSAIHDMIKEELEKQPKPGTKAAKAGKGVKRLAAGQVWYDNTLDGWPDNDFRIFVGDLGNETNDEVLAKAFQHYSSFKKARVVKNKRTNKTKGFGFVSLMDPIEGAKALKEMQGKYIGNRPVKLRKSTWHERNAPVKEKRKNQAASEAPAKRPSVLHK